MNIQDALRDFLRTRNLTQSQFAELTGVNKCGLSKFMKRVHGDSIAERIYPYLHGEESLASPPERTPDSSPVVRDE